MLKPVEFYKNKLELTKIPVIVPVETKSMLRNLLKVRYNVDVQFFETYLAYMDNEKIIFAVRPLEGITLYPVDMPIKVLFRLAEPKIKRLVEVLQ